MAFSRCEFQLSFLRTVFLTLPFIGGNRPAFDQRFAYFGVGHTGAVSVSDDRDAWRRVEIRAPAAWCRFSPSLTCAADGGLCSCASSGEAHSSSLFAAAGLAGNIFAYFIGKPWRHRMSPRQPEENLGRRDRSWLQRRRSILMFHYAQPISTALMRAHLIKQSNESSPAKLRSSHHRSLDHSEHRRANWETC